MQKIPFLLTRPVGSNADFFNQIPKKTVQFLQGVECPLIKIEPFSVEYYAPRDVSAVFTSSNGLRFGPPADGRTAYCVGRQTTQRATEAGWNAIFAGQTAVELLGYFDENSTNEPLCHFSGVHVREDVVGELSRLGLVAHRQIVYDQVLLPLAGSALSALSQHNQVIVPLFSPRAAAHFAAVCPQDCNAIVVALSATVAKTAGKNNKFEIVTAQFPTTTSLIACIETLVSAISLG
ncbi:MAG: uroporphyrinogen-III synthase [Roseobacter sp.]